MLDNRRAGAGDRIEHFEDTAVGNEGAVIDDRFAGIEHQRLAGDIGIDAAGVVVERQSAAERAVAVEGVALIDQRVRFAAGIAVIVGDGAGALQGGLREANIERAVVDDVTVIVDDDRARAAERAVARPGQRVAGVDLEARRRAVAVDGDRDILEHHVVEDQGHPAADCHLAGRVAALIGAAEDASAFERARSGESHRAGENVNRSVGVSDVVEREDHAACHRDEATLDLCAAVDRGIAGDVDCLLLAEENVVLARRRRLAAKDLRGIRRLGIELRSE